MRRLAVDIGGTFTDFVLEDTSFGTWLVHKQLTSDDPATAVLEGLEALLTRAELSLADVDIFIHATTLATNAVLQRKAGRVALITTRGFRDVLQIQRQKRYDLYDLFEKKVEPLIPRSATWEVTERVAADGSVITALDTDELRSAAAEILAKGFDAVAVAFLHSYINSSHETAAAELIQALAPELPVSTSSQVAPVFREYERTNTTVVNAFLRPVVERYLRRLANELSTRGYTKTYFVMHSGGGMLSSESAAEYPVRIIESGPAAGVLVAQRLCTADQPSALSFDMGGTTAKLCVLVNGEPSRTQLFEIDRSRARQGSGLTVAISAIDLVEVGRGGGSIARVADGILQVGPDSAGSSPGPVCYGRGGTRPTVTDADLVLGLLDPDNFLGGDVPLDLDAAERAIRGEVGEPLGLTLSDAAWAIHAVVNANMARAARLVTVEQGRDPREMSLIAFGGAGPVHATRLALDLGIRRVLIPVDSGVTAAHGLLMAEVAVDYARTYVWETRQGSAPDDVRSLLAGMKSEADAAFDKAGVSGERKYAISVDARFQGQGYELSLEIGGDPSAPTFGGEIEAQFRSRYQKVYGYWDGASQIEILTWRLSARVVGNRMPRRVRWSRRVGALPATARRVFFIEATGYLDAAVYQRADVRPGDNISGPAVIEERESTAVLLPRDNAVVDEDGTLIVHVGGDVR